MSNGATKLLGAGNRNQTPSFAVFLRLNYALRKTILSKKFYQEISSKILSSSSTIDSQLYFICYFSLLVSSVLNNKSQIRAFLRKQRYKLLQTIRKAYIKIFSIDLEKSSNKSVSQVFTSVPPSESEESTSTSQLAVRLKSIYSYLADVRIFNRLFDSIKYIPWILDEYSALFVANSPTPIFDKVINFAQALNCLFLELFENAGWLTDHNWVNTSNNSHYSFVTYIWCCRIWGAYILIDIIEQIRRVPVSKWDKNWKIALFKNAIQMPLVVHWSLEKGCLTPFWVGLCGCGASWWNFRKAWLSLDLK